MDSVTNQLYHRCLLAQFAGKETDPVVSARLRCGVRKGGSRPSYQLSFTLVNALCPDLQAHAATKAKVHGVVASAQSGSSMRPITCHARAGLRARGVRKRREGLVRAQPPR
jgi:hypothetical protein